MASLFAGYEVDEDLRPGPRAFRFDLDHTLASVVGLHTRIPEDAMSARSLGTQRVGNAIVIRPDGLLLTIGYLLTEAEQVTLIGNDGATVPGHVLGIDAATGFGLVYALEPLGLPALPIGDSATVHPGETVVAAGAGGRAHALTARLLAREPFSGYWEYHLDAALFVEPDHPHWNGAALIGPTGDLIGVGSLHMQHMSDDGEARGLNLFVPAELLPPILDDLSSGRPATPPRPWLGVLSRQAGPHVMITDVTAGGPAARAELRPGDIIHRVAGKPVRDLAAFYKGIWALGAPGVFVPLTVQRENDLFDVEVRSGDRASRQRRPKLN